MPWAHINNANEGYVSVLPNVPIHKFDLDVCLNFLVVLNLFFKSHLKRTQASL